MSEDKAVYYLNENVTSLVEKLQNYIYGLKKEVLNEEEKVYLYQRLDEIEGCYGNIYCELIKETKREMFNRIFKEIHILSKENNSDLPSFIYKLGILVAKIDQEIKND